MAYVTSAGVSIQYEVEGDGPALVLLHGLSDSLASGYEFGYVAALRDRYKLILVDARGHGASEKPTAHAAYATDLFVADVVAVLDDLNARKAHFFGYSMGGWIAFAMAKYALNRVSSLIIGGRHPYPGAGLGTDPYVTALKQGPQAIASLWDSPLSPSLQSRLLKNDAEALLACRITRIAEPGFADILPTMTMPCLLFAGDKDPVYPEVTACIEHMPNVRFFSIPGLGHCETFFRSDLVLPHVTECLAAVEHGAAHQG